MPPTTPIRGVGCPTTITDHPSAQTLVRSRGQRVCASDVEVQGVDGEAVEEVTVEGPTAGVKEEQEEVVVLLLVVLMVLQTRQKQHRKKQARTTHRYKASCSRSIAVQPSGPRLERGCALL
jgi:hypothetical protein